MVNLCCFGGFPSAKRPKNPRPWCLQPNWDVRATEVEVPCEFIGPWKCKIIIHTHTYIYVYIYIIHIYHSNFPIYSHDSNFPTSRGLGSEFETLQDPKKVWNFRTENKSRNHTCKYLHFYCQSLRTKHGTLNGFEFVPLPEAHVTDWYELMPQEIGSKWYRMSLTNQACPRKRSGSNTKVWEIRRTTCLKGKHRHWWVNIDINYTKCVGKLRHWTSRVICICIKSLSSFVQAFGPPQKNWKSGVFPAQGCREMMMRMTAASEEWVPVLNQGF